jgi:hypothetical protein
MSHAPMLPGMSNRDHAMAPASLDAFRHISETLTSREKSIALAMDRYRRETGHDDVTGGELAAFSGIPVTSVRPRLTGLVEKGWLEQAKDTRPSRVQFERPCQPYRLVVPMSAIQRIKA